MHSHVCVKVAQVCPTLCNAMDYTGQNTGVGSLSLPKLGMEPRSLALLEDSLPAEPQGKPLRLSQLYLQLPRYGSTR